MRTKYNKTNPPGRQSGIEDSLSLQENAGIEDGVNNFYGIGGDDYYYLEVEKG